METGIDFQKVSAELIEIGVPFLLNALAAIVIFFIGKWIAKMVSNFVSRMMLKAQMDVALAKFVKSLVYISLFAFTIIAAIGKIGVQTASFVAVLGAAGLAVGMALQGTLSNFAAGVMIILFRPFVIGDFIEAAGTSGSVKEIQIFNTILASPDNKEIILPNSKVSGNMIINYSKRGTRRIELTFGISYDDDIKKAKEVLMNMMTSDERVLKDPAPVVGVNELADSSVNIICRPWVNSSDFGTVRFDLIERGKEKLEEAGMSIPYPQRDVHHYNQQSV